MTSIDHPAADPRRISITAAVLAIASALAAAVLLGALHVLSPEYSPAWRMVSEYANGRYAWVLSLMFTAYGASTLAVAYAIRSQVAGRSGGIGLGALVLSGIGQAAAAAFDLNQVLLHELAGILGIMALPVGAVLISRNLARQPRWSPAGRQLRYAAHLTWITVVLWIASFPIMVATFAHALGTLPSTPPSELPAGVIALVGWTCRLLIVAAWAWVIVVAWHAIRVRREATMAERLRLGQIARAS
ncbi:MAG TPA: DUF998 domain-containing protein [Chloroflexota bacterium]